VIYAPKVARGLSPGFNPGNPQNNEFALKLKGQEADKINLAPIAARKLNVQLRRATIRFCFHVVSTLNLPPLQLQGVSLWVAVPRVETLG